MQSKCVNMYTVSVFAFSAKPEGNQRVSFLSYSDFYFWSWNSFSFAIQDTYKGSYKILKGIKLLIEWCEIKLEQLIEKAIFLCFLLHHYQKYLNSSLKELLCIFKQWKRGSESYLLLLSREGLTTDWCVSFSELASFFCNNVG